jgi:hypothetical protein
MNPFRSSNTWPVVSPVNASRRPSRDAAHHSGLGWLAKPFPWRTFTSYSLPALPGALSTGPAAAADNAEFLVCSGNAIYREALRHYGNATEDSDSRVVSTEAETVSVEIDFGNNVIETDVTERMDNITVQPLYISGYTSKPNDKYVGKHSHEWRLRLDRVTGNMTILANFAAFAETPTALPAGYIHDLQCRKADRQF